jgi:YD repeat-containing protein
MAERGGILFLLAIAAHLLFYAQTIAGSANYTYDVLNRLIKVERNDGKVVEYTYDEAGNRLARTVTVPPPVVSFFTINRGAASTLSASVTLNNSVTGGAPTDYMASESSSFAEPYATALPFPLSAGYGTKRSTLSLGAVRELNRQQSLELPCTN